MSINPQLVFLGDSLTQFGYELENHGWLLPIQEAYSRKADVLNWGYSGYNTTWLKPVFEEHVNSVNKDKVKLITIFMGANDAVDKINGQHVELEEYKQNVVYYINTIKSELPSTKILLVTPPPLFEQDWYKDQRAEDPNYIEDRFSKNTKVYAEAIKEIGKKNQIPVLDSWEFISGDDQSLFIDGLHFSKKGNQVLYQEWTNIVNKEFPELSAEKLDFYIKYWKELL